MGDLFQSLKKLLLTFQFCVVIAPWEQSLRVRWGSSTTLWGPGLHWRIPLVDAVYIQSVRFRLTRLERQTISTRDGRTVTLSGSIGYTIEDIGKLYATLHHADSTIRSLAMVAIAQYVSTHDFEECTPALIVEHLGDATDYATFGLGNIRINLTDFVVVKTYRLVGDHMPWSNDSELNTEKAHVGTTDSPNP